MAPTGRSPMAFLPDGPTYGSDPYWYYSAQYVFPTGPDDDDLCATGAGFKAQPGDVLLSVNRSQTT
jgi:hypothetical protein